VRSGMYAQQHLQWCCVTGAVAGFGRREVGAGVPRLATLLAAYARRTHAHIC
jgi:hypothetical protein